MDNAQVDAIEVALGSWIDTNVIAECIIESAVEKGIDLTVDQAKQVWLRILERLHAIVDAELEA